MDDQIKNKKINYRSEVDICEILELFKIFSNPFRQRGNSLYSNFFANKVIAYQLDSALIDTVAKLLTEISW